MARVEDKTLRSAKNFRHSDSAINRVATTPKPNIEKLFEPEKLDRQTIRKYDLSLLFTICCNMVGHVPSVPGRILWQRVLGPLLNCGDNEIEFVELQSKTDGVPHSFHDS